MELLSLIFALVFAIIAAAFFRLTSTEIVGWVEELSMWLLRKAASRLPDAIKDKELEEWSADLREMNRPISKLLWALDCFSAQRTISRDLEVNLGMRHAKAAELPEEVSAILNEKIALLEDVNRQKTKFIDHVSYQLRTPISTIIGFSEMLDGQMFGALNDRQKDYIASIMSASYHLRDLINDIVDLSAIEAGQLAIHREDVDIRKLLESAATFAALSCEDKNISLKVDCPKSIGVFRIDQRRIKQVIFNLLSNAFACTGSGGQIVLGAKRVSEAVHIWVQDTGSGISEPEQAKVFNEFYSKGLGAGAGVGLSLVERIIELHGGEVILESELARGTKVTCQISSLSDC